MRDYDDDFYDVEDDGGRRGVSGLVLDFVAANPTVTGGGLVILVTAAVIVTNAVALQPERHPAPLFPGSRPQLHASASVPHAATFPATVPSPAPAASTTPPAAAATLIDRVAAELARRNFYRGPIDGTVSPQLDAAIRQWQSLRGLAIDGKPSAALLFDIGNVPVDRPLTVPPAATAVSSPAATTQDQTAAPQASNLPRPRPSDGDAIAGLLNRNATTQAIPTGPVPPASIPTPAAQPSSIDTLLATDMRVASPLRQAATGGTAVTPPARPTTNDDGLSQARALLNVPAGAKVAAVVTPAPATDQSVIANQQLALWQRTLQDLGYGPTNTDGIMTQQTRDAVKRFERDRGLPITGEFTGQVVEEMRRTGALR